MIDAVREAVNGLHGGSDVVTIVLSETEHGSIAPEVEFSSKEGIHPPILTVHWSGIVPEFPTWTAMLPLFVAITVSIALYRRKKPRH